FWTSDEGTIVKTISASWAELMERTRALNLPLEKFLVPGVSEAHEYFDSEVIQLPQQLSELYSLCGGSCISQASKLEDVYIFPGYYMLHLEDTKRLFEEMQRCSSWKHTWIPLFSSGAGD